MQVFLESKRLILRWFAGDDADNLFDLDGDPEVMRFLIGGELAPRTVIENETMTRFLQYYERFEGFGYWAAVEKSTGRFLGWFEFRPREGRDPDEVELGYRGCVVPLGQGLHQARRAAHGGPDDGGQHRLSACDGEVGPESGAGIPSVGARRHREDEAR